MQNICNLLQCTERPHILTEIGPPLFIQLTESHTRTRPAPISPSPLISSIKASTALKDMPLQNACRPDLASWVQITILSSHSAFPESQWKRVGTRADWSYQAEECVSGHISIFLRSSRWAVWELFFSQEREKTFTATMKKRMVTVLHAKSLLHLQSCNKHTRQLFIHWIKMCYIWTGIIIGIWNDVNQDMKLDA